MPPRLLIIGNPHPTHVGRHLLEAAESKGLEVQLLDSMAAYAAPRLLRALFWRLLKRRPVRLESFGAQVAQICLQQHPDVVLATGIAPLSIKAMQAIRKAGSRVINFLTDDPWNSAHDTPWFMRALPHYHHVFTPRRANMNDLQSLGGPAVSYLPFAFQPSIHCRAAISESERQQWHSEVLFIGGADADRVPVLEHLADEGFNLGLWGGYWSKVPSLTRHARGHADADRFATLVAAADTNLCLVRRANRDGHSMRTFELAACGATMLVEDTGEHREFFGAHLEKVAYFQDVDSLINQTRHLLHHPDLRLRLAEQAHQWAHHGGHTYAHRLMCMLASTRD